jgi:hypothetical protein
MHFRGIGINMKMEYDESIEMELRYRLLEMEAIIQSVFEVLYQTESTEHHELLQKPGLVI